MSQWKKPADELPPASQNVIICAVRSGGDEHDVWIGYHDPPSGDWYWEDGGRIQLRQWRVTHWQPMPAPPEDV